MHTRHMRRAGVGAEHFLSRRFRRWLLVLAASSCPALAAPVLIDFESAPTGSFSSYVVSGVTFTVTTEPYGPVPEDRPHFLGLALGGSAGIAPNGTQGLLPVPVRDVFPWIAWDGPRAGFPPGVPDAEARIRNLHPAVQGAIAGGATEVSVLVGNYPTGVGSSVCVDAFAGNIGSFEYFLRAYDGTGRLIGTDSLGRACTDVYADASSPFLLELGIDAADIAAFTGGTGSQIVERVLIGTVADLSCPGALDPLLRRTGCTPLDSVRFGFLGLWTDNFAYTPAPGEPPPIGVPEPGGLALALSALALAAFGRRAAPRRP